MFLNVFQPFGFYKHKLKNKKFQNYTDAESEIFLTTHLVEIRIHIKIHSDPKSEIFVTTRLVKIRIYQNTQRFRTPINSKKRKEVFNFG